MLFYWGSDLTLECQNQPFFFLLYSPSPREASSISGGVWATQPPRHILTHLHTGAYGKTSLKMANSLTDSWCGENSPACPPSPPGASNDVLRKDKFSWQKLGWVRVQLDLNRLGSLHPSSLFKVGVSDPGPQVVPFLDASQLQHGWWKWSNYLLSMLYCSAEACWRSIIWFGCVGPQLARYETLRTAFGHWFKV